MPRACTVCGHPKRAAIDAAIRAGETNRDIGRRFEVGEDAIRRHAKSHVAAPKAATDPPTPAKRIAELARTERAANANRRPRTAPTKVAAAGVEQDAVRLRVQGRGFREIAAELGVSVSTAFEAVDRVLARTRAEADENSEHVRAIELARCDKIIASLWERATDPTNAWGEGPAERTVYSAAQDKAAATLLRAMQRRAKLLGIDADAGINVTIVQNPAFQEVTRVVFDALEPFPEARDAVMARLREAIAARRPKARLAAG